MLIAILIAGGCGPAKDPDLIEDYEEVIIYVKAIKVNGINHLEMFDSNDLKNVVTDDLETFVTDGTKVFRMLAEDSGLKKIKNIGPKDPVNFEIYSQKLDLLNPASVELKRYNTSSPEIKCIGDKGLVDSVDVKIVSGFLSLGGCRSG